MQEQGSECMEPVQAPCGFARQSQYQSDSRFGCASVWDIDMNGTLLCSSARRCTPKYTAPDARRMVGWGCRHTVP